MPRGQLSNFSAFTTSPWTACERLDGTSEIEARPAGGLRTAPPLIEAERNARIMWPPARPDGEFLERTRPTRMIVDAPIAFATREALERWLKQNHAEQTEFWVRIFKKASGTPSVDWPDCVVAALAWGWIDGQRKSLDEVSYLQRLTPRRPRSIWSKRNCQLAEQLIAEGRMQAPGLAQVQAARRDGRWEHAYAGSATMVIPDDFVAALERNAAAKKFFAALDRRNLFAIYARLHSAKKPETRSRRIAAIVKQLASGKPLH